MPSFLLALFPAVVAVAIGVLLYEEYICRPQLQEIHPAKVPLSRPQPKKKDAQRPKSSSYTSTGTRQRNNTANKENGLGSCDKCNGAIQREYDLNKLPCDHQFHVQCISNHFEWNKNSRQEATCPVGGCGRKYSLSLKV